MWVMTRANIWNAFSVLCDQIPAFAFNEQRSVQEDSHFALSMAARLAEISLAVSAPKGVRER